LREFFEEVIPEDINKMVENLNEYRKNLKGDFEEKVKRMNEITDSLKNKE
jgi:precorrin-2 dehydrogenase/sirohydrochlorin ferrochelatase